ncbi:MAG: putative Ig domain-containing protein [Bryobacteraceae bacterium]
MAAHFLAGASQAAPFQSITLGILSPGYLPTGLEGIAYGPITYTAEYGTGGYTWSVTGLPAGLTLSSAGVLSGTPAIGSSGTYNVVATVRDSSGNLGYSSLLMLINQPTLQLIPPPSMPAATEGVPYSFAFTATGSLPPYAWTMQPNGPYPVGMSFPPPSLHLNPVSGIFSGTPAGNTAGTYGITVTVYCNASGQKASMNLIFTILPAGVKIIAPTSLPNGATLLPYVPRTFGAFGGTEVFSWSATGLPPGLTMSSDGTLSGTPGAASAGSYNVQVTVKDSNGSTATASLPLNIVAPPVLSLASPPPTAYVNQPYPGYTLTAAGPSPPYTFKAISGMPPGMAINPSPLLTGTPAAGSAGSYTIQLQISDSGGGYAAPASLPFTVAAAPPLTITGPSSLPAGTETVYYGLVTFTSTGGLGAIAWKATGLPTGLTMSTGGMLAGTPVAGSHGTYDVQVMATDSAGNTASVKLSLIINASNLAARQDPIPAGMAGIAYGPVTLTAGGGTAPYTWSVSSGMPNGLTLSSAGVISGTPAAGSAGTYTLAVILHDANGATSSAVWSLVIETPLSVSSPASLPVATEGLFYGPVYLGAVGGSGSYTWNVTTLPTDLGMSTSGMLSGTPALGSHGSYPIQFIVRDSNGFTGSATLTLTVQAAQHPTITSPLSLAACEELVVCPSQQFAASGGAPPYTWSAAGLPADLAMSPGGLLSGTPSSGSRGAYAVTVTARDSAGFTGTTGALALTINAPPQISGPASLPTATPGAAYGPVQFTAANGTPPYTWSESGALPSGIVFSGSGALSGQPAAGSAGSYNLTVQLTDSFGVSSKVQLTLIVRQSLAIVSPSSLAAATEQVSYPPVTFTAAGGAGGYSWSATGVPMGLTMSAGGVLGGTPAIGSNGWYTLRVTVADSGCNTAATVLGLVVDAAAPVSPAITGLVPNSATAGGPAFQLVVNGMGFQPGAVVAWSSVGLSTTFGSATQLTAAVPASMIGAAGTAQVRVANLDGTVSSSAVFTVIPALPTTSAAGIVNAASWLPALAPGALIAIFGTNQAAANAQAQETPLPTALGRTSVLIGGTAIPLLYVSPGQINAQIPYETAVGPATLVVESNGVSSAPAKIQVAAAGPGVMMYGTPNHVLAVNLPDGSLNQSTSPAMPGQYVTAYLIGQGLVSNPVATGAAAPASPFSEPLAAVQVTIGGQPAYVQFAGLAPGFVGLLQLNVQIPDVPAGDAAFRVSIGGVAANDTVISVGGN